MRCWLALVLLCVLGAAQDSFESEFRSGLLALNRNDLVHARASLDRASRLRPENALVWAALAQTCLRSKDTKLAHEAAERAAALGAENPVAQHALAVFYSEAGDFSKAAEWEQKFASSSAADSRAPARAADFLGRAYAAANQPESAIRAFQKAVEGAPEVESFVFDLGQAQLHASDFAGALATFDRGRQRWPSSAQMHLAYGVAAYGQRRFTDAIDAFLRVTQLDPSVEQPYVFLARILDHAGDRLPRIVAAYAAWEKVEPRNALPPCLHAKALGAAGEDSAKVEAELRRSIRLNDRFWQSHFELGALLAQQRNWQEAATELARSIKLNPKHAPAHFQLARVYDRLGKPELAQAERAEHQRLTAAETGAPGGRALP